MRKMEEMRAARKICVREKKENKMIINTRQLLVKGGRERDKHVGSQLVRGERECEKYVRCQPERRTRMRKMEEMRAARKIRVREKKENKMIINTR
jgi:hypothetical protein